MRGPIPLADLSRWQRRVCPNCEHPFYSVVPDQEPDPYICPDCFVADVRKLAEPNRFERLTLRVLPVASDVFTVVLVLNALMAWWTVGWNGKALGLIVVGASAGFAIGLNLVRRWR